MSTPTTAPANRPSAGQAAITRRVLQLLILIGLQGLALFLPAGRLDWWNGWAYLGVYVGMIGINALIQLPRQRDLVAERGRTHQDAKEWDRVLVWLLTVEQFVVLVVAGLHERLGWNPAMALWLQLGGLALGVAGFALASWAMGVNRFFSGVVRIQKERGHTVIADGPYRLVRHPGYVGLVVTTLATPLLLGSAWALIPAGLGLALIILRTALEDRTLQDELEGYAEYAQRVRYRLLPGAW